VEIIERGKAEVAEGVKGKSLYELEDWNKANGWKILFEVG
jgi:hypothetical protein